MALLETGQRIAKYGINCRRKIEPCWTATGTIIPTTNNSNIGYNNQWNRNTEANATLWTIICNFLPREDALSRKTAVNSLTDTNPENLDQEHDINV